MGKQKSVCAHLQSIDSSLSVAHFDLFIWRVGWWLSASFWHSLHFPKRCSALSLLTELGLFNRMLTTFFSFVVSNDDDADDLCLCGRCVDAFRCNSQHWSIVSKRFEYGAVFVRIGQRCSTTHTCTYTKSMPIIQSKCIMCICMCALIHPNLFALVDRFLLCFSFICSLPTFRRSRQKYRMTPNLHLLRYFSRFWCLHDTLRTEQWTTVNVTNFTYTYFCAKCTSILHTIDEHRCVRKEKKVTDNCIWQRKGKQKQIDDV